MIAITTGIKIAVMTNIKMRILRLVPERIGAGFGAGAGAGVIGAGAVVVSTVMNIFRIWAYMSKANYEANGKWYKPLPRRSLETLKTRPRMW